ncbi:transforming growth factor beta-1-induced transcript 1 protein [Drosophila grimshawi]|uniref:GH10298 n=1 Tax=Drosophila grimshawi TaxID=7222 RepID=B4JAE8_DROGR|nr:transforming growth factor beta-1-induced transcript 1 protein [Drosophila grimshawi]XP_032592014.1 transforming growth factor beta-1-induced transcript 1 protein [Drosophila grimshawi]EDW03819.1 GH10298 [Drosophila grimshawi]
MESKSNDKAVEEQEHYQCHKCKEMITKRVVCALGKRWHPEHFLCRDCDKQIKDDIFNIQEGEPVCSECFLERYTSTCAACKEPILDRTIRAMGTNWHENCFVCDGACKQPLKDCAFFERDGKAYCKQDYEDMFAVRCAKCEKPITENAIVAMNAKWHSDCFCCNRCENPITTKTFTIEGDKPICPACTC